MTTTNCTISDTMKSKIKDKERVRVETSSGAKYDGIISEMDCMGVLFIPEDKTLYPAYILYTDIKKFMLPEHKVR